MGRCIGLVLLTLLGIAEAPAQTLVGANKHDLFDQYLGIASSGDGSQASQSVQRQLARKAIADAAETGFGFLRVAVSGYGSSEWIGTPGAHPDPLSLWQSTNANDRASFWAALDAVMRDASAAGLRIVPVLMFNQAQFPAHTRETVADLVSNPGSRSRRLLKAFTQAFLQRYRDVPFPFIELTNELALDADVDSRAYCLGQIPARPCTTAGNFRSPSLVAFGRDMVGFIKSVDPRRLVSSGYAINRDSSAALVAYPAFGHPGPASWKPDSRDAFLWYFDWINSGFDVASVHIYSNTAFTAYGRDWDRLIGDLTRKAHAAGRKLFIGEFGERGGALGTFTRTLISASRRYGVDYAALWTWEFHQWNNTDLPADLTAVEPGVRGDDVIGYLRQALAARATAAIPRLVITQPLPCQLVWGPTVTLRAVASSPAGIRSVTFSRVTPAGEQALPAAGTAPWQAMAAAAGGTTQFRVTAVDGAGLRATAIAWAHLNGSTAPCTPPSP